MKQSTKTKKEKKVKKTTFTLNEYDKAVRDLEFITAALDVTVTADDPDVALPILCEAVSKSIDLCNFIKTMSPSEVTV